MLNRHERHYLKSMPPDCITAAPTKRMARNPIRIPYEATPEEEAFAAKELAYRRGAHQAIFFVGDIVEQQPESAVQIIRAAAAGARWLRLREADIGYWDNWIECGIAEVLGIGTAWKGDARPPRWREFIAEMRRGLLRHPRGRLA